MNGFIKKVVYAVGANLISLFVSVLTTLVIPAFFGDDVSQYGYFQIYLFYVGYIGFFHLGWCDGIYLRDGGKSYDDLNKPLYSGQFWLLSFLEIIIAIAIVLAGKFFSKDANYAFIWMAIALNILIYIPKTMLSYFLQTTNRIREYALLTTAERVIYGISIVAVVLLFSEDYRLFVYGDIFGKLVALGYSVWWCRDIVLSKPARLVNVIKEALVNVSIGAKLMFANVATMLITGIVRWGIQTRWDVATYGKISFTLSVSNLLLVFFSAVALVLYPTLRRNNEENLKGIYATLRDVLMIPLLGCLIVYYPIEFVLSSWLPQYAESMRYMAILFPMCIFSAKMAMLIQTYMNVYRLEKEMLKVNLIGVVIAIFTTVVSVFIMRDLTMAMISIVINQVFRCVYAESVLTKKMDVHIAKESILEVVLSVIFMVANWFIGGWQGVFIYTLCYFAYVYIKRESIMQLIFRLKSIKEK